MIKLTTFIKAYKIILSNISDKVSKWGKVYLDSVDFDNSENVIFTFISSSVREVGVMGISAGLNIELIENIKGGLDNITISKEYINTGAEINEAGRMLIVLDNLFQTLTNMGPDFWEDTKIKSIEFDFDKGLAIFETDLFKAPISTDGRLVLIGN